MLQASAARRRERVPVRSRVPAVLVAGLLALQVQAATFIVGTDDVDAYSFMRPQRTVELDPGELSPYAVSYGEWETVRSWAVTNGYVFFNRGRGVATNHPVYAVSWLGAVMWCNARSEMEDLVPSYYHDSGGTHVYRGYRLPVIYEIDAGTAAVRSLPGEGARVVRGGSWDSPAMHLRAAYKGAAWSTAATRNIGFRYVGGLSYRLPRDDEWEVVANWQVEGGLKRFPTGDTVSHTNANFRHTHLDAYVDAGSRIGFLPEVAGMPPPRTVPVDRFKQGDYYNLCGNLFTWVWGLPVGEVPFVYLAGTATQTAAVTWVAYAGGTPAYPPLVTLMTNNAGALLQPFVVEHTTTGFSFAVMSSGGLRYDAGAPLSVDWVNSSDVRVETLPLFYRESAGIPGGAAVAAAPRDAGYLSYIVFTNVVQGAYGGESGYAAPSHVSQGSAALLTGISTQTAGRTTVALSPAVAGNYVVAYGVTAQDGPRLLSVVTAGKRGDALDYEVWSSGGLLFDAGAPLVIMWQLYMIGD